MSCAAHGVTIAALRFARRVEELTPLAKRRAAGLKASGGGNSAANERRLE